jgi:hypothetical protein
VTRALASILGCVAGTVVGFVLGSFVGGNFATELEFAGQRGYDAAPFGALVGIVVGALVPWLVRGGVRNSDGATTVETAKLHNVDPAKYLLEAVRAADRGEILFPWQMPAAENPPAVKKE